MIKNNFLKFESYLMIMEIHHQVGKTFTVALKREVIVKGKHGAPEFFYM